MRQHEPGQQSDGQAPPRPPRLRNLTTVDFVWAAVVVGTVAYWFQAMKDVWFFIDEWPMSASKIQKFKLRQQLMAELGLSDKG